MKNYFENIEYPVLEEKVRKTPKKEVFPEKDKFDIPIKEAWNIIEMIQTSSNNGLVPYPIHLTKGRCPATSALDTFSKFPSEAALKTFIELSKQDFNWKVAKTLANIFSSVYPKTTKWVRDD